MNTEEGYGKVSNKFDAMDLIASIVAIIGALNWGLIGIFKFDLVENIFGKMSGMSRIIYGLVGLAGLYMIYTTYKIFVNGRR